MTGARGFGYRHRAKEWMRKLAIGLICLIVAGAGLLAWPFGKRRSDFDPKSSDKILVIRLDLLGDLVLSMPAVQALKDTYPKAAISMLVLPYTSPLLDHYGFLDKVFTFDVNRLRPSGGMLRFAPYRDLWRLLGSLRAERYDLAISLHGVWAGMFAFASGAPFRAGYFDESCPFTLNLGIAGKRYRSRRHEADYCLDIARSLGAPSGDYSLTLSPSPPAEITTRSLLDQFDVVDGEPLVAIHMGATNGSAKRWTVEGLAALADRLMCKYGVKVILTGAKGDLPMTKEVVRLMSRDPIVLAGMTSIPELVSLLSRCRLLISGDSGPMHIANALGVPVVAIHGPTDPAHSGPYGRRATVLRHDVPCSPCYDLTSIADCPKGDPICMKGIKVDEVYAAAKVYLDPKGSGNP